MSGARKRGRRSKAEGDTRATIKRAAKECLANARIRPPSLRSIAERAGVDQALVLYYFGSMENLFAELGSEGLQEFLDLRTLGSPSSPTFGTALVKAFLERCESRNSGMSFDAFYHGAIAGSYLRPLLTQVWTEEAPLRLQGARRGPQDQLVTQLVVSELLGLAISRYLLKLEPLASASIGRVAATYGPALTRLMTTPEQRRPHLSGTASDRNPPG